MVKINPTEMQALLNAVGPGYCLAKWYQSTLHLHNGVTQSCHHVKGHRLPLSEKLQALTPDLHNTQKKHRARAKMIGGERPKECQYCWNLENSGNLSDRAFKSSEHWALPQLHQAVSDQFPTPTYLEIGFERTCHLKCLYCSPNFSSAWAEEIRIHGPLPTSRLHNNVWQTYLEGSAPLQEDKRHQLERRFWEWWPTLAKKLKVLRVTGGEPILASGFWKTLNLLESEGYPTLDFSFTTGLSFRETLVTRLIERLFRVASQVNSLTVFASIDSVGAQAEYIRHGLDTRLFFNNVNQLLMRSPKNVKVSFIATLSLLSLPGLVGLLSKIRELREQYGERIGLDTPYLKNPEALSIFVYPKLSEKWLQEGVNFVSSDSAFWPEEVTRLRRCLDLLQNHKIGRWRLKINRYDFKKIITECDRRRGLDFQLVFPELAHLLDRES